MLGKYGVHWKYTHAIQYGDFKMKQICWTQYNSLNRISMLTIEDTHPYPVY